MAKTVIFKKKTSDGLLQVEDTVYDDEAVCFLVINETYQSAMYLDPSKYYDLVFPYMQRFSYVFQLDETIKDTFLIGGGAFAYPKYYVHQYPDSQITVAETNTDIISVAFQYFGLHQLSKDETKRLHILNEDGFQYLRSQEKKYDLIINDAFIGKKDQGRSEEETDIIYQSLKENGFYIVNVGTALAGPLAKKGNAFRKMLQKKFKHTVMIPCEDDRSAYEIQNVLMIGSDRELV